MCTNDRYAKLNNGRCRNRRCDDVVCRRRDTHAEDDRRDHCEKHRWKQHPARKVDEPRSELQADTGLRDNTDNDARRCTSYKNGKNSLRTADQPINNLLWRKTRRRSKTGTDNGKKDGHQSRTHRRIARDKKVDEDDEWNRQMTS